MRCGINFWLPTLMAFVSCALLADDDNTPPTPQPKSRQAIEARAAHDHSVKQWQDAYYKGSGVGPGHICQKPQTGVGRRPRGKNLDEANRINAEIKSMEGNSPTPSGDTSKNIKARLKLVSSLAGTKWLVGTSGEVLALNGDGTGQFARFR